METIRCLVCEKTVIGGNRPITCTKFVQFACCGPKMTKEQTRIIELEKTVKSLQSELQKRKEPEKPYCQCCGQEIIGHECGC